MLQTPRVPKWLGGIEPAWTLLDFGSFNALRHSPSPTDRPVGLAADLTLEKVQRSAVAMNMIMLLRAAALGPGLKLTLAGNLARSLVTEMADAFKWPDFDKEQFFRHHKVINEPDFLPLYFIRNLAEIGKLLRRHKGHLRTTPAARRP